MIRIHPRKFHRNNKLYELIFYPQHLNDFLFCNLVITDSQILFSKPYLLGKPTGKNFGIFYTLIACSRSTIWYLVMWELLMRMTRIVSQTG